MNVEVIIPWLGFGADRERNLRWLLDCLDYPVTIAPGALPWCKARALWPAIQASTADILIIHDADVVVDLALAVGAVAGGRAWAVPHQRVIRLSSAGTEAYMRSGVWETWGDCPLEQPPYEGILGGGVVVLRREVAQNTPMDPRFVGWGQEDLSYGIALNTLHGAPWRGTADLIHLWHPPQPRMSRRVGSQEGHDLHWRYQEARDDPAAMRELVAEVAT